MRPFQISHLASGGMITNYFCTSRCRHCLYNCGPHWEKNYIDRHVAKENLSIVLALGCRSIHIGGGEPMLRPDGLGETLEVAAHLGMTVEYVETNSSWFQDIESAEAVLTMLRHKGLSTLLVSISPFHNEFIPFFKVQGVIAACRKSGIHVFPWITDFVEDLNQFDRQKTHDFAEFENTFGKDYLSGVLKRYWIHLGGRALDTFRPILIQWPFQQILDKHPDGCARELSDTSHFHVDLFGNYIPGLCSGLAIATQDLGNPLPEKQYPILTTLFRWGINGIYKLARQRYGFVPKGSGYVNKCDLCMEIRTFMVKNQPEKWTELRPKGFYANGHL